MECLMADQAKAAHDEGLRAVLAEHRNHNMPGISESVCSCGWTGTVPHHEHVADALVAMRAL
jgi:hypothetical protein